MSDLARIKRCLDISADDIAAAVTSRDGVRALLQHASSVSRPDEGGARVLIVFARMAEGSGDWLDGPLRVEVGGDDEVCVIETFMEIGGGLRERVFPPMTMNGPKAM